MRITVSRIVVVMTAVAASVWVATPAWAHVTANPDQAPADGYFTTFFSVPHGCESSAPDTTQISIKIPDGVVSVTPEDVPGWRVTTKTGKLAEPYTSHGETITEGVREVSYTATGEPLSTDQFRRFGLSLRIAAEGEDVLYFPTVQECEKGTYRWVNIPPTLDKWGDTEDPAPYLELTADDEQTGTNAGQRSDAEEAAELAATRAAADAEPGIHPLVYVALGFAALALLLALAALLRKGGRTAQATAGRDQLT